MKADILLIVGVFASDRSEAKEKANSAVLTMLNGDTVLELLDVTCIDYDMQDYKENRLHAFRVIYKSINQ